LQLIADLEDAADAFGIDCEYGAIAGDVPLVVEG